MKEGWASLMSHSGSPLVGPVHKLWGVVGAGKKWVTMWNRCHPLVVGIDRDCLSHWDTVKRTSPLGGQTTKEQGSLKPWNAAQLARSSDRRQSRRRLDGRGVRCGLVA